MAILLLTAAVAFLTFLLQAYEIYQEQFPISYLQAKFENIDNEWQIYI